MRGLRKKLRLSEWSFSDVFEWRSRTSREGRFTPVGEWNKTALSPAAMGVDVDKGPNSTEKLVLA